MSRRAEERLATKQLHANVKEGTLGMMDHWSHPRHTHFVSASFKVTPLLRKKIVHFNETG